MPTDQSKKQINNITQTENREKTELNGEKTNAKPQNGFRQADRREKTELNEEKANAKPQNGFRQADRREKTELNEEKTNNITQPERRKKPEWTAQQTAAIKTRGVNLLVSASAGSGKTTVMIERIVSLLCEGHEIDEFFVSTFTKAAAADMKNKLVERLRESGDKNLISRIKKLPDADITNFDSFCKKLLSVYFYKVGVDPAFKVLGENEQRSLFNSALDDVIEDYMRQNDAEFTEIRDYLTVNRRDHRFRMCLKELYDIASLRPDPVGYLNSLKSGNYSPSGTNPSEMGSYASLSGTNPSEVDNYAFPSGANPVEMDNYASLSGTNPSKVGNYSPRSGESDIGGGLYSPPGYANFVAESRQARRAKLIGEIKEYKAECEAAGFVRNADGAQKLVAYLCGEGEMPVLRGSVGEFESLNEVFKSLKEEAVKLTLEENLPSYTTASAHTDKLVEITFNLSRRYDALKKKKSRVDFADLEHYAYEIMSDKEIAAEVNSRYKFVFVDEYQDVNPLQEEVIAKFTGEKFMVGDVKQSIYAFRGCRPEIFLNRAKRYIGGEERGVVINLNANYRCGRKIVEFVNEVFDDAMTEENSGVNYSADARLVFSSGKEGFTPRVISAEASKREERGLYDITDDSSDFPEAEAVVSRIEELVAGIEENGIKRKFSFGEIAVLFRSAGENVSALISRLRAAGIPFQLGGKSSFTSIKQVRMLLSCLKAVDNNMDETAMAGAMLSYLGEFTPDELLEIKSCGQTFLEAVNRYEGELSGKLSAFKAKLDEYVRLSREIAADELAGKIIVDNEFFLHTFAEGGDADGLDEFLDYICQSPVKGCLHEFLSDFERSEPSYQVAAAGNAVRLMTIHGSKGLEFPAVILMNAGKKFNFTKNDEAVVEDKDIIAVKYFDDINGKEWVTDLYQAVLNEKNKTENAEELRLLYVALTRAQEFLEVYGTGHGGYMSLLEKTRPVVAANVSRTAPTYVERIPVFIADDALTAKIKRNIDYKKFVAPTAVKTPPPEKTYVTKLAEEGGAFSSGSAEDGEAAIRGTAYHKAMELIDFQADFDEEFESLPSDVCRAVDKPAIKRAVEKVKQLTTGMAVCKEQAFIMSLNTSDEVIGDEFAPSDDEILVQGVIDLIARGENSSIIVDFKTGGLSEKAMRAYKKQLALYKRAAQKILDISPDTYLYSFKESRLIKVDL